MIISIEGIPSNAKNKFILDLVKKLEGGKPKIFTTSFNTHEIIHPIIRQLGEDNQLQEPLVYSYMELADFAFRYEELIKPEHNKGNIVIADGYLHTAYARSISRGLSEEFIRKVYGFANHPDIAILLDTSHKDCLRDIQLVSDITQQIKMDNNRSNVYKTYEEYLRTLRQIHMRLAVQDNALILDAARPMNELIDETLNLGSLNCLAATKMG